MKNEVASSMCKSVFCVSKTWFSWTHAAIPKRRNTYAVFFSTSPAPACFACFHQQLCTKVFLLLEFTGICLLEWMSCWRKESGFTFIRNFASHAGIALMIMPPSRYHSRTNKGRSWIVASFKKLPKIGVLYWVLYNSL